MLASPPGSSSLSGSIPAADEIASAAARMPSATEASWLPSSGESLRISTAWVRLSSAASAMLRGVSSSSGVSSSGAPRAGAPSSSFSAFFFGGFFPGGLPEGSSSDAGASPGSSSCSSSSSSSSGSFFGGKALEVLPSSSSSSSSSSGGSFAAGGFLPFSVSSYGLLGRLLCLRRRLLARPAGGGRASSAGFRGSRLFGLLLRHLRLPLHDEKPPLVGCAIDQRDFLDEHVEQAMNAPLGGRGRRALLRGRGRVGGIAHAAAPDGASASGTRRAEPPIENPVSLPSLTSSQSASDSTWTPSSHVPCLTCVPATVRLAGAR